MKPIRILTVTALSLVMTTGIAAAGTLENLERERAMTVETFLDPNVGSPERSARLATSKRRLVDLERMVLRDDGLRGQNNKFTRQAFKNYDVTFMAHAAIEKNYTMVDNWLDQFSVSTDSLMAARTGRR